MKKLSLALSFALSLAAIAALQARAPQAPSTGERVTVTGCFERAVRNPALDTGTSGAAGTSGSDATSTGATGTTGTSAEDEPIIRSDTKWVLTAPSKKTTEGTVGTSGRPPKIEYRLDIADESNFAAHEGHTVQITGTVEKGQAGAADRDETNRGSRRQAAKLKVESVKMISENCSM